MTNQKSLSISHVNVGYATGGKFPLISLLMEVTLTIIQRLCQPLCVCAHVCMCKRETEGDGILHSTVCVAQTIVT